MKKTRFLLPITIGTIATAIAPVSFCSCSQPKNKARIITKEEFIKIYEQYLQNYNNMQVRPYTAAAFKENNMFRGYLIDRINVALDKNGNTIATIYIRDEAGSGFEMKFGGNTVKEIEDYIHDFTSTTAKFQPEPKYFANDESITFSIWIHEDHESGAKYHYESSRITINKLSYITEYVNIAPDGALIYGYEGILDLIYYPIMPID